MKKTVFLAMAMVLTANATAFASGNRVAEIQEVTAESRQVLQIQLMRELATAKKNIEALEYQVQAKRGEMTVNGLETVTLFLGAGSEAVFGVIFTSQLNKAKSKQAGIVGFSTTALFGMMTILTIVRGKEVGLNMQQVQELQKTLAAAKAEIEEIEKQLAVFQ
jgi:hypothetical protein